MNQVIQGDSLDVLPGLPEKFFHTCVTSPPYYGLRDYKVGDRAWPAVTYKPIAGIPFEMTVPEWTGCLGMEPTPEMFVAHIVLIFREVWRVLRDDGTLWLNFGDSYARTGGSDRKIPSSASVGNTLKTLDIGGSRECNAAAIGLKNKDLMGIPWRVAFALQADGWYLRQDEIWHKPNPMPESVRDRCTKAHEYVFLLSKSERYYYDHEAIKEKSTIRPGERADMIKGSFNSKYAGDVARVGDESFRAVRDQRNKRSVWTVATKPCSDAHFAVYPPELIEPCILAGAPVEGHVLDPFGGAGTTGMVCKRHRRNYTLIELSAKHCAIAERRIAKEPHPQLSLDFGSTEGAIA